MSVERHLIERNNNIIGVNTPYIYVGSFGTSLAFHVEDFNLYSISYLHKGDPKTWYVIPPKDCRKLEKLAQRTKTNSFACAIKHKIFMPSQMALQENKIPFGRIRRSVGEFVVTFLYRFHGGFNNGFNVAEAINFGTKY